MDVICIRCRAVSSLSCALIIEKLCLTYLPSEPGNVVHQAVLSFVHESLVCGCTQMHLLCLAAAANGFCMCCAAIGYGNFGQQEGDEGVY